MNSAPRLSLWESCELTAAEHIHPLRKEDDAGQKEGDSPVGADRQEQIAIHKQKES